MTVDIRKPVHSAQFVPFTIYVADGGQLRALPLILWLFRRISLDYIFQRLFSIRRRTNLIREQLLYFGTTTACPILIVCRENIATVRSRHE